MKLRARARQTVLLPITLTPESMVLPSSAPPPSSVRKVVEDMQGTKLFPDQMQAFGEPENYPPRVTTCQNDELLVPVPHATLTESRPKARKSRKATNKGAKNVEPILSACVGDRRPSKKRGRPKKVLHNEGNVFGDDALVVAPSAPMKANRQRAKKTTRTEEETTEVLGPREPIRNIHGQRQKRLTKEEKGKATIVKPRQPRLWVPHLVVPNDTIGVCTRAKKSLNDEFHANADILEVLRELQGHDTTLLSDLCAPESQHTLDSMATQNISSLKYQQAREQSKNKNRPRTLNPVEANPDLYEAWDTSRAKWAVLVPNRFLSESSFHTGYTPSWTQGHILGEYVVKGSGTKMVLCDLGDRIAHMNEIDCRIALGSSMTAEGSEAGHGYGWWKRVDCFNPHTMVPLYSGSAAASGDTVLLGDNVDSALPAGLPISDYEEPSDVECANGTQDSTARTTFPKVSTSLPQYFSCSGDDEKEAADNNGDSSGEDWIPSWVDCVSSSDDDIDDYVPPMVCSQDKIDAWCRSHSSYKPVPMDLEQLQALYRPESWSSTSVQLLGSRDNFTGPTPGYKLENEREVPKPEDAFLLYWSDETLQRIVSETNRYARAPLMIPNEPPKTKGGPNWVDTTVTELKGWFGICVLLGVKDLPSIRHYWMRSEDFIYCHLIAKVMTLARSEQLLRCLHLVDNNDVVRDTSDPRFDRLVKTRWMLDMFVRVSRSIYNLERELTVDECVIPYKGRYCFIRQFMPDKPIRFGIKCWILASSKSRFVSNIEVYFGEGTGAGVHGLGYSVVTRMLDGLEGRGHCLIVDNLFASVNLFHHLMVQGVWATGTVRRSSKNLPLGLYRTSNAKVKGSMLIRMHEQQQMSVVSWQDKKLVTLISTAVAPWAPNVSVLRRVPTVRGQLIVPSSPIHLQYQEYMRGVDVTDQLHGNYSSQLRSHKWWHKLVFFILDQAMVNAYVIYSSRMEDLGLRLKSHMQFKIAVGKALVKGAIEARAALVTRGRPPPRRPLSVHGHWRSKLKRICIECGFLQKWYCPACGYKWMCRELCYYIVHERLSRK